MTITLFLPPALQVDLDDTSFEVVPDPIGRFRDERNLAGQLLTGHQLPSIRSTSMIQFRAQVTYASYLKLKYLLDAWQRLVARGRRYPMVLRPSIPMVFEGLDYGGTIISSHVSAGVTFNTVLNPHVPVFPALKEDWASEVAGGCDSGALFEVELAFYEARPETSWYGSDVLHAVLVGGVDYKDGVVSVRIDRSTIGLGELATWKAELECQYRVGDDTFSRRPGQTAYVFKVGELVTIQARELPTNAVYTLYQGYIVRHSSADNGLTVELEHKALSDFDLEYSSFTSAATYAGAISEMAQDAGVVLGPVPSVFTNTTLPISVGSFSGGIDGIGDVAKEFGYAIAQKANDPNTLYFVQIKDYDRPLAAIVQQGYNLSADRAIDFTPYTDVVLISDDIAIDNDFELGTEIEDEEGIISNTNNIYATTYGFPFVNGVVRRTITNRSRQDTPTRAVFVEEQTIKVPRLARFYGGTADGGFGEIRAFALLYAEADQLVTRTVQTRRWEVDTQQRVVFYSIEVKEPRCAIGLNSTTIPSTAQQNTLLVTSKRAITYRYSANKYTGFADVEDTSLRFGQARNSSGDPTEFNIVGHTLVGAATVAGASIGNEKNTSKTTRLRQRLETRPGSKICIAPSSISDSIFYLETYQPTQPFSLIEKASLPFAARAAHVEALAYQTGAEALSIDTRWPMVPGFLRKLSNMIDSEVIVEKNRQWLRGISIDISSDGSEIKTTANKVGELIVAQNRYVSRWQIPSGILPSVPSVVYNQFVQNEQIEPFTLPVNNTLPSWMSPGGATITGLTGLPAGMTFDASTWVVSGTPTASGSFTVSFTVTSSWHAPTALSFVITVTPRGRRSVSTTPSSSVSTPVELAYEVTTITADDIELAYEL